MPASHQRGEGWLLAEGWGTVLPELALQMWDRRTAQFVAPAGHAATPPTPSPFLKCVLTFMQIPKIPPKALQGLGSLKSIHGCQVKTPYITRPCVWGTPWPSSSRYLSLKGGGHGEEFFLVSKLLHSSSISKPSGFTYRMCMKACYQLQGSGTSLLWNQA